MSINIYMDSDNSQVILQKSIEFIQNLFSNNPNIETLFAKTTKGFEVMFSLDEGCIMGYWNSENGNEDYAPLEDFLEIHKLEQLQSVKEILDSAY